MLNEVPYMLCAESQIGDKIRFWETRLKVKPSQHPAFAVEALILKFFRRSTNFWFETRSWNSELYLSPRGVPLYHFWISEWLSLTNFRLWFHLCAFHLTSTGRQWYYEQIYLKQSFKLDSRSIIRQRVRKSLLHCRSSNPSQNVWIHSEVIFRYNKPRLQE